jgi:hypothetical protein
MLPDQSSHRRNRFAELAVVAYARCKRTLAQQSGPEKRSSVVTLRFQTDDTVRTVRFRLHDLL